MTIDHPHLSRRGFLRIASAAGLGLGLGLQRGIRAAVLPGPAPGPAHPTLASSGKIMVGLDMGSSKIRVLVGEKLPDSRIKVFGVGEVASAGIRNGEVVDSNTAVKCVRAALVDAEQKTSVIIGSVHLAVFGGPDIHRSGGRIKHCIQCVNDAGVEVDDVTLRPLASAATVLTADDKERGALVIDIGAGTTSYIAFAGGGILGWGVTEEAGNDLEMEDEARGQEVQAVIRRSVHDVFARTKCHMAGRVRLDRGSARVHLTGGGSPLHGVDNLAEEVFGIPSIRGVAKGIVWEPASPQKPQHACAIGLLKLGAVGSRSYHAEAPRRRYLYVIPSRAA